MLETELWMMATLLSERVMKSSPKRINWERMGKAIWRINMSVRGIVHSKLQTASLFIPPYVVSDP